MSDTEPEAPEIRAAVRELARRHRYPHTTNPDQWAADAIDWLTEHGWRVLPKPPSWRALSDQQPADPKTHAEVLKVREKFAARKTPGETQ